MGGCRAGGGTVPADLEGGSLHAHLLMLFLSSSAPCSHQQETGSRGRLTSPRPGLSLLLHFHLHCCPRNRGVAGTFQ